MGGAKADGGIDTAVFHSGKASFRITNASAQKPNSFGMLAQNLTVKPNTRYDFSAWVKGKNVGIAWLGGGPDWSLRVRFEAGTFDWRKYSGSFTTKANETTFNLIVAVESMTDGLWLDDVEVVPRITLLPSEYTVTEKCLADPEAVSKALGTDLSEGSGVCVFGYPYGPGEVAQLAATGVKLVRTNMHWAEAEPEKGKFSEEYWKTYNGWVDGYREHGIRMLVILAYGNPKYGGEWHAMAETPERRAAFARFAAEAVRRLSGKGVIFELWNEPDGAVSPEEYMALAKATIPAMRKVDPNVVVVGPAAHHYATAWLETCLQYGLLNLFDAVSVHLYFGMPPAPQPMPELNLTVVEGARRLVAKYAHGRNVPIVNSEWGYKRQVPSDKPEGNSACVSTRDHTKYLPRAVLLSRLWDLKFNVWFCWWLPDESIRGDGDYGLVTPDLIPMPAYYAMKTLSEQLPKGKLVRRVAMANPEDYVLEFDTSAGRCWAVWTSQVLKKDEKPRTVRVPVPSGKRAVVTDVSGSRTYVRPIENGAVELEINDSVQYLRLEEAVE